MTELNNSRNYRNERNEENDASTDLVVGNTDDVKGLDANRYATKKTVAQGMLDIALLTSNASQLKYVLQVGQKHEFYYMLLVLISLSIILQTQFDPYGIPIHDSHPLHIDVHQERYSTSKNPLMPEVVMGIVLLSLNLLRDCRFHQPRHRTFALNINYGTTAVAFVVTVLNVLVSAFDSSLARYLELDYI